MLHKEQKDGSLKLKLKGRIVISSSLVQLLACLCSGSNIFKPVQF